MSLTLNSTLQARLDTTIRHPIVKVTSESFGSDIPFEGNSFVLSNGSDYEPDVTRLSTEQFAMVRGSNTADGIFYLLITDASRSYWTSYAIQTNHSAYALDNFSICEMTDGNLYITFQYLAGGSYYLRGWICSNTGSSVSSSSIAITSAGTGYVLQDNYVMYDSDAGAYLVFYTHKTNSGPVYKLAYRSSSDGLTWGGETIPSLSGISSSNIIRNVHVMQASDNDIVLSFEYEYATDPVSGWEVMNTYYSVSQDNGSTWSAPTAVTGYTAWGESGIHPQVEITDSGTVYFTYSEVIGVSYFDHYTSGVLTDHSQVYPSQLHFYNNWIYCVNVWPGGGPKELSGMYVIDPTDMSLVKQYTQTTTPGFTTALWSVEHSWYQRMHSDGKYMVAGTTGITGLATGCKGVIAVATYDGVDDQVVEYVFNGDLPSYSLTKNITADANEDIFGTVVGSGIRGCAVDAANDRLYVLLGNNYLGGLGIQIGYIDLTETPDGEGQYSWNEVYSSSDADICSAYGLTLGDYRYCFGYPSEFRYCPNNDLLVYTGRDPNTDDQSLVMIINATQGVVQTCKAYENDSRFPYDGPFNAYIYDNILYGDFKYQAGHGQSAYYGLFVWDMITDTVRLDRPNYVEQDDYYFWDADFSDISNGYIWFASTDGAVRYNVATHSFDLFDGDSVPGYGGAGWDTDTNYTTAISVNTGTGDVYSGSGSTSDWSGVRKFNPNGSYEIGQYATGTKSGISLGLGAPADLTINTNETNIAIVSDEDNVFWAFWNHEDVLNSLNDIHWGRNLGAFDFSSDLVKGSNLEISWDVEYPSTLTFICARGHLYDRLNALSTLNNIFQRGRKIAVQLGENISDTEYWHNQGTFIVEEVEVSYKRGEHPEITVQCCDLKRLWQEHKVILTDYYDGQLPDTVIENLLDGWTVLTGADYNISSFTNEHTIWLQLADISFWEILRTILDHFGYIGHFDVDGVFVNKAVDFDKAVDHTYSDLTQIDSLSPQDNYGSFINQVRVIGETHTEVEVLYGAEQVASRNGTMGWWCERQELTIYYSEDRTMIGRNPYLDVSLSLADFQYFIFKGGGREYISEVDTNNRYCVVTLDGPNLIGVVIGLAVSTLGVGYSASTCTVYCGPWIYALSILTNLLIYALCAVANYAFNIWVQPIGYAKETVQYLAEDTTMQDALNGQTIVEEIEDPLCYTVAQCQMVAEHEIDVARYQRNRLKFRKIYHLQDELLDKVSVIHPYSQQSLETIITNLKRIVTIGGEVMDEVEGWRTN